MLRLKVCNLFVFISILVINDINFPNARQEYKCYFWVGQPQRHKESFLLS